MRVDELEWQDSYDSQYKFAIVRWDTPNERSFVMRKDVEYILFAHGNVYTQLDLISLQAILYELFPNPGN